MSDLDPAPRHHDLARGRKETETPVGRLTDEQRAQLAAATPEDRERRLQDVRLEHLRHALGDADAERRASQADADSVLDQLRRGEDAHRIRRELRRLGVLSRTPGRSRVESRHPAATADHRGRSEQTVTEPSAEQDRASSGTPRWVKGFAIAGIVLLVLILIMLLTGHGPGRHMHGLGQIPPTEQSVQTAIPLGDWSGT